MDPLGLALENFNAMGLWRDKERGQSIDSTGKLISGESFRDVRELKRILKDGHKLDFYRCMTEKLLTYALGRGLDYNDVEAVDQIVDRLDRERGTFSALLMGVIESPPFQKRRSVSAANRGIERVSRTQSPGTVKAMKQDHSQTDSASTAALGESAAAHFCAARASLLALPAFESLLARGAAAAGTEPAGMPAHDGDGPPLRMAFVYVPNGVHQGYWWPKKEGKDFELNKTLAAARKGQATAPDPGWPRPGQRHRRP